MLMDILMEALMSMDDESLDYVLESCDADELEIISDALEMTFSELRNDPDVKEYTDRRKMVRKTFADAPEARKQLLKDSKEMFKPITAAKLQMKQLRNESENMLRDAHDANGGFDLSKLKSAKQKMEEIDRKGADIMNSVRSR